MKTVFTASELMTVAVKEIARMCQTNSEPIPSPEFRWYCWTCGEFITAPKDKAVHDALRHDTEPEGEPS